MHSRVRWWPQDTGLDLDSSLTCDWWEPGKAVIMWGSYINSDMKFGHWWNFSTKQVTGCGYSLSDSCPALDSERQGWTPGLNLGIPSSFKACASTNADLFLLYVCLQRRPEEGVRCPGTGVIGSCEPSCEPKPWSYRSKTMKVLSIQFKKIKCVCVYAVLCLSQFSNATVRGLRI